MPAVPALLAEYRSLTDPVAELRSACSEAVRWLLEGSGRVEVLGEEPLAGRIAAELLTGAPQGEGDGLLVVANGSARRGEKAPGHLDVRSFAHDEQIGRALEAGDGGVLQGLDPALGAELLASGIPSLRQLGERLPRAEARVLFGGDPFGVQYWVATWSSPAGG